MGILIIYVLVKFPLYTYESLHDLKEAWPYYRQRIDGFVAKIRRKIHGFRKDRRPTA
jgi:hypothetical protein